MRYFLLNELTTAVLSFLGGLLSFIAGINIQKAFKFGFIRRLRLGNQLRKAQKNNDSKSAEYFQILLVESKLYSNDEIKQSTSISTILQLEPERSFMIFIERLGSKPVLSASIKRILINEIKELVNQL
jgi:tRNA(Ser,Leu) C12 N-acetylase TAN1